MKHMGLPPLLSINKAPAAFGMGGMLGGKENLGWMYVCLSGCDCGCVG